VTWKNSTCETYPALVNKYLNARRINQYSHINCRGDALQICAPNIAARVVLLILPIELNHVAIDTQPRHGIPRSINQHQLGPRWHLTTPLERCANLQVAIRIVAAYRRPWYLAQHTIAEVQFARHGQGVYPPILSCRLIVKVRQTHPPQHQRRLGTMHHLRCIKLVPVIEFCETTAHRECCALKVTDHIAALVIVCVMIANLLPRLAGMVPALGI